jgi:hypothetical protein
MLSALGQMLIYIVPFLLVLTFVVTIHELGHYLIARLFNVKMDRFAIGFGRALLSRTDKRGVEWRIGWMPLGGYVKFSGDLDAASVPDQAGLAELRSRVVAENGPGAERDYFHFKPVWQRALITAGGPFANFVLAITLFTILFSLVGVALHPARIAEVTPGSPAAIAGFRAGDVITEIEGKAIRDSSEVMRKVNLSSGDDPGRNPLCALQPRPGGGGGRAPDGRNPRHHDQLYRPHLLGPRVRRSAQRPAGHGQGLGRPDQRRRRRQSRSGRHRVESVAHDDKLRRHTFDRNRLHQSDAHPGSGRWSPGFLRL